MARIGGGVDPLSQQDAVAAGGVILGKLRRTHLRKAVEFDSLLVSDLSRHGKGLDLILGTVRLHAVLSTQRGPGRSRRRERRLNLQDALGRSPIIFLYFSWTACLIGVGGANCVG